MLHSLLTHVGYLDPGTGSIIIQAVVGVAAGIAVFGRRMIGGLSHKIRSLLGRRNKDQEDVD